MTGVYLCQCGILLCTCVTQSLNVCYKVKVDRVLMNYVKNQLCVGSSADVQVVKYNIFLCLVNFIWVILMNAQQDQRMDVCANPNAYKLHL